MKTLKCGISEEYFIKHTGRSPVDDDMERVNCKKAGEAGHESCGWRVDTDMPTFMGDYAGPVFKCKTGEV